MITTKENYLAHVTVANTADGLHAIHEDVKIDATLHSTDKDEICEAIRARFGELNAKAQPPEEQVPRWATPQGGRAATRPLRCKHLVILCVLCDLCVRLSAASGFSFLNDGPGASRRLAALSMIESGDNDLAIGRAGEVSRFQILPAIWRQYASGPSSIFHPLFSSRVRLDPCNPFTARNIAAAIMHDRCNAFERRFHRSPSDQEFYLLWARPSYLLALPTPPRAGGLIRGRAQRFANLVNR